MRNLLECSVPADHPAAATVGKSFLLGAELALGRTWWEIYRTTGNALELYDLAEACHFLLHLRAPTIECLRCRGVSPEQIIAGVSLQRRLGERYNNAI